LLHLHYRKNISLDETIVICPIDPYVEDEYFNLFIEIKRLVDNNENKIALIGAIPTYPSQKYGYILPENGKVREFHEKPDEETAERLIEKGAIWNCGVFAIKIGYLLNHARQYIEINSYEDVINKYEILPKKSIDYEIVEIETSIGYMIYSGVWKDIGTWNTLTEVMNDNIIGNNIILDSCGNTHIINMLEIPVISLGIENAVIIASPDGILVSTKPESAYMKPHVDKLS